MTDTFSSILDTQVETISRPPPLPPGTYTLLIKGQPKIDKTKNENQYAEYTFELLQPHDDVDQAALAGIPKGIAGRTLRGTFWLTEDSLFRITDFATMLGIELKGKSLRQILSEIPGHQVNGTVENVPTQDGQALRAQLNTNKFSAV